MINHEVIIVGGGPAGMAASLQLSRYGIEHIILERFQMGGLLNEANLVENYLGFPNGISGEALVNIFKSQILKNSTSIAYETVMDVNFKDSIFILDTDKQRYYCKILVVASGTTPKIPPYEISDDCENRVYSSVLKLSNLFDKKIAVIGAGDAAFDYSINLSKNNKIFIFNRSDRIKSLPLLYEKICDIKNISYFENMSLENIQCFPEGIVLKFINSKTNKISEFNFDYLLFAIGREPEIAFLSNIKSDLDKLDKMELIYFIGDVKNGLYRQTSISVGDGIECAMKIYKKLRRNK